MVAGDNSRPGQWGEEVGGGEGESSGRGATSVGEISCDRGGFPQAPK